MARNGSRRTSLTRIGLHLSLAGAVGLLPGCGASGGGGSSGPSPSTTAPGTTTQSLKLASPRALHTATLLGNGEIFVAGGVDSSGSAVDQTAIVSLGSVRTGPRLSQARVGHATTVLASGQVLILGGQASTNATTALDTTELYDPLAGVITAGPRLTTPRSEPIAVTFGSASAPQVLVAGGTDGKTVLGSAEALSVSSMKFGALKTALVEPVAGASAARLDDGSIVIVGGDTTSGPGGAQVFDPLKGSFSAVSMTVRRSGGAFAATGREAFFGGGASSTQVERSSETYDMASRVFVQGAYLTEARRDATASVYSNGVVLVGGRLTNPTGTVEVLQGPSFAQASLVGVTQLATPRYAHTATIVSGRVIVIGGFDKTGAPLASIENVDPTATTLPVSKPAPPTTTGVTPGAGTQPVAGPVITSPVKQPASPGLGGILGGVLGSLTGGQGGLTGGSVLGKVATAGIQTILTNGFSGGFFGFLKAFAGNLIGQFFGGSSSPAGGSGSSGILGTIGSFLGKIFGGGGSSTQPPAAQPTITSLAPLSGHVGDSVVIQGDNLGTSGVTVEFKKKQGFFSKILGFLTGGSGKTSATVSSIVPGATPTQVVVTVVVPNDAETGDVTVTTSQGKSLSAGTFTVQ